MPRLPVLFILAFAAGFTSLVVGLPRAAAAGAAGERGTLRRGGDDDEGETPAATDPNLSPLAARIAALDPPPDGRPWQTRTTALVQQLQGVSERTAADATALFDEIELAARELWDYARWNASSEPLTPNAARLSRAAYELHRQCEVRRLVDAWRRREMDPGEGRSIPALPVAFSAPDFSAIDPAWRSYLALDALASATPDERPSAAQTTLARLHSTALNARQSAQARELLTAAYTSQLRRLAASDLDAARLLRDLDGFLTQENGLTSERLNRHYQAALWSADAEAAAIASHLDNHYRNANVRLTISETLINRLLEHPFSFDEPVRDQILGARVVGKSRVTNQLGVQLVPDPTQWNVILTTRGNIDSLTQAHRDGFVVHSVGEAQVVGSKHVAISFTGIRSESPSVRAVLDQKTIDLDSPYDHLPLLGWTARRLAQRQQQATAPLAEQQVRARIRHRVAERMEREVGAMLDSVRQRFERRVIEPLSRWNLEPQPIELSTSAHELVLRYRLAGFDQLAASTPRPVLDRPALASLQVHESAVNNLLQRLDVAGRAFSLEQLVQHLQQRLGFQAPAPSTRIDPQQVQFHFAPYDPLRLDFDEQRLRLSLRLKRIQLDDSHAWRNVTVFTDYELASDGFHLVLRQTGGVHAAGSRLRVRDEMAVAALFNHVLQDEYRYALFPESEFPAYQQLGLRLQHLTFSDGWLSLAYEPAELPPIVQAQARQTSGLPTR